MGFSKYLNDNDVASIGRETKKSNTISNEKQDSDISTNVTEKFGNSRADRTDRRGTIKDKRFVKLSIDY